MKITEIAYTCYAISDVKTSRAFYEGLLGLVPGDIFEGEDMAFIEYNIGAHTLAIGKGAPNFKPGLTGATVAFEVDDFDGMVKKLKDAGVKFLMDSHETTVCFMALVQDPNGNQLMIHHRKPKTK